MIKDIYEMKAIEMLGWMEYIINKEIYIEQTK